MGRIRDAYAVLTGRARAATSPVSGTAIFMPPRSARAFPGESNGAANMQSAATASLIYACVDAFRTSVAEPPLVAYRGKERLDSKHLLGELVEKINQQSSGPTAYEYTERLGGDDRIFGEALVQIVRGAGGKGLPRELNPLPVHQRVPIMRDDGTLERYEFVANGMAYQKLRPEDVMAIRRPGSGHPYKGLSPLTALSVIGHVDEEALVCLSSYFDNGAIPGFVVTSQQQMGSTARLELAAELKEISGRRYGGFGGVGFHEPLVLDQGATITPFGIDPSKLDIEGLTATTESRVCSVMATPAIIVGVRLGLTQSQAYGTAEVVRGGWWRETLVPYLIRLGQIHTKRVALEFGPEYSIRYDLSQIGALKKALSTQLRDAAAAYSMGAFSRADFKRWIGEEPAPGDENVYARAGSSAIAAPATSEPALAGIKPLAALPLPVAA